MPNRAPKWRRNPAQRPKQILDAALAVFADSGLASATLDEIADRAGVSKGTIYLYFPSKEELFRQTVIGALSQTEAPPPPEAHVSATRHLLDTVRRHWHFLTAPQTLVVTRLVGAEQWQFPDLYQLYERQVVSNFTEELTPVVRRGIASGEFRELDPDRAARMLTALVVHGAVWRKPGADVSVSEESSDPALREITDFYLQAIALSDSAFPQADGAPNDRAALNS